MLTELLAFLCRYVNVHHTIVFSSETKRHKTCTTFQSNVTNSATVPRHIPPHAKERNVTNSSTLRGDIPPHAKVRNVTNSATIHAAANRYNVINSTTLPGYTLSNATKLKNKLYILHYNVPNYLRHRPALKYSLLEGCSYDNCVMTYKEETFLQSDAVIFKGIQMPRNIEFKRPEGQIWIFGEYEPLYRYDNQKWWYTNKEYAFNWTMTYNGQNTDIFLPYGGIRKKMTIAERDIMEIARQKNKTALIILSHCKSPSQRMPYIERLKEFVDVDVLGACGMEWACGKHFVHDKCFEIINKYRFYFAFENSFCDSYFTEKLFDNFNYDSVLVTRGGLKGQAKQILPKGTFISTDDFQSATELGLFMKEMTVENYANILSRKNEYYAIGKETMYRQAMCQLCHRLNHINDYKAIIKDIKKWAYTPTPCLTPDDLA